MLLHTSLVFYIVNFEQIKHIDLVFLEAFSKSCKRSMMEIFAKIINTWKPLTISAKCSILDVWQVFEYASSFYYWLWTTIYYLAR